MTRADELAGRFATMRARVAENFHGDTYRVMREPDIEDRIPDGHGGYIAAVPQEVETGRCRLDIAGRLGSEGVRGVTVTATSLYTAELPIDSVLTETDTLEINGREFAVIDVKRGGQFGLFTIAELEERS